MCLANRVTLGQATPDGPWTCRCSPTCRGCTPRSTREDEGYLLESMRRVLVNGVAGRRTVLHPNDLLTLGSSCRLRFLQPLAGCQTARLHPE